MLVQGQTSFTYFSLLFLFVISQEKMRAEQSKFIASLSSSGYAANDNSISAPEKSNAEIITEQPVPLCSLCRDSDSKSPLCYLILLQVSD